MPQQTTTTVNKEIKNTKIMNATLKQPEFLFKSWISTNWKGIERQVFSTTIGTATITAGSLERLRELAANHQPQINDGAKDYYNNGHFNND